jgi:putative transposase
MSEYRRVYQPGGSYFFTLVRHQRINLSLRANFARLQSALDNVMRKKPLTMEAFVFLPDGVGGSASLDPPYDYDEYAHSVALQFALADDSQIR